MYGHQCSQAISDFAIKACVLATKLHMLRFYKACAVICCGCNLWEPITQDTKRSSVLRKKKSKAQIKRKLTTTFGKSLFLTQYWMRYAICILLNTKDLAINLTIVAYGNRQNAIMFARANNSDSLRALKPLMETRLSSTLLDYTAHSYCLGTPIHYWMTGFFCSLMNREHVQS